MTFEELMAQWLASGPQPGTPAAVPPAPVTPPVSTAATAQPKLMPGGGGVTGLDTSLPSAVTSSARPPTGMSSQMSAGIGSLAALPMQLGALFANKPATVKSGADEFLAEAATQRSQGIAEMMAANPNMNQALAQRNAAQAHAQQSKAIAERAAAMRVAADNANAQAQQQAKQQRIQGVLSGLSSAVSTGMAFASDERIKTNVQPAGTQVDQMLAGLKPVQFDVPRAGEQARTGIMAQDLMQSPMGARMVQPAPDGTLKVDGSAALEGSLAANARLNERLSALEQTLAARAGGSINEMVQRDLASRTNAPSSPSAPSPVGADPGIPTATASAPPPVVPPTPTPGAPVSADPEGQAILDRVYQATQPMMSPKQGDPFEDLLQASQQGPNFTLPGRASVPVFSKDPAVKSFPDKPPPAEAAALDVFGKGGGEPEPTFTGPSPSYAPGLQTSRGVPIPSGTSLEAQARRRQLAETDQTVAPEARSAMMPADADRLRGEARVWTPMAGRRITFEGADADQQEALATLQNAAATNPRFFVMLRKFDESKGPPLRLQIRRNDPSTVVGGPSALSHEARTSTGIDPASRHAHRIDVGDLGVLPSLTDPNFRNTPIQGGNREAMLVHEVVEAMVMADFRSNDPKVHEQAWKLYVEAHDSALNAERAVNAFLGSRSQRLEEQQHPGGSGLETTPSGTGVVRENGAPPSVARFRFTDGWLDMYFDAQGHATHVRRVPNTPETPGVRYRGPGPTPASGGQPEFLRFGAPPASRQ